MSTKNLKDKESKNKNKLIIKADHSIMTDAYNPQGVDLGPSNKL